MNYVNFNCGQGFSDNFNDNKKFYLILFLGILADRNFEDAGNTKRNIYSINF